MATRFYMLHQPGKVVFDEVHFGKFASYYLRRTFFFDVHPPLAKMLLAFVGYFVGYDGNFLFKEIGLDYVEHGVPYVALRAWPALCGALVVPILFMTMRESGYSLLSSTLVAILILLDNGLVTQSRLILLDSMLMLFMCLCLYCYIRFHRLRYQEYSVEWWAWLCGCGTFMALTLSVKMVGLFTVGLIGVSVLWDLWGKLDIRKGLTMRQVGGHFAARAFGLILLPFLIYLASFWVHFLILNHSGPGDNFMSLRFQSTLEGNRMISESLEIRYGDNITLQHLDTKAFLHSHPHNYPLRYKDQRVSTTGQQVTGYGHPDANNFWRIWPEKYPTWNKTIKHMDIVRLEHGLTGDFLLTHDVASPLTTTNTEVTLFAPNRTHKFKVPRNMLWRIEVDGAKEAGEPWKSHAQSIRLVHVNLGIFLHTHPGKLPEWGFSQQEVNGNKKNDGRSNLWVAREVQGRRVSDQEKKEREVGTMPFLAKFWELQTAMIRHNNKLTSSHPYQSEPFTWPLLLRGISFWTDKTAKRQIYLLGNPFGWWLGAVAILGWAALMLADALCRRRGLYPMDQRVHGRLWRSGGFLLLAWALHYGPFFLMGRQLFLHHYLPSCILAYAAVGVVFEFALVHGLTWPLDMPLVRRGGKGTDERVRGRPSYLSIIIFALIVAGQAWTFWYFSSFVYGHVTLTPEQVIARKWLSSWDFHFSKAK
ncbi:Dolichyl-phosphate-mannose-protein mannosyltransferase-domain-containing protein [Piptocephalis cylindrospora]|uniref:Dolichyl-phosphate-mannose--protein mannosyltransferase n=1 Tax=Piptocephalis cylindrospora TaxID=1907219 RepID=A0A4V1IYQ7_9FUNG|nr:Dolichyl-phosphate-mannose-protein mannosyltransferase-domain-containing protein [Piptocephalis cylindrospora]|eukprot:RKP15399.1 Dolichyl-phosphate-mannose-protein mannosyltransferase-domain-containing protein [Piptocephalis cylindrospora]